MSKQRKNGKKSKFCLGCFITMLVVPIILCGAAFGVGWVMFDKHVKPEIGLNLGQTLDLVFGLYGGKEKDFVTNPYDKEADLKAFMDEFKRSAFISADTDVSVADILSGVLNKPKPSDGTATSNSRGVFANGTNETGSSYLDALLNKINFDFSSLEKYDGTTHTLKLTDKQVAAIIQEAFTTGVEYIDALKSFKTSYGIDLGNSVEVKQVVVGNSTLDPNDIYNKVTLKINLKKIVEDFLIKNNASKVKFSAGLLPKAIYASATVYPNKAEKSAEFVIENYNAKQKKNFFTMLDKVLPKLASGATAEEFFVKMNKGVVDIFSTIKGYVPISFEDTSLKIEPLAALMRVLKVDKNVSEQQFLTMIKQLKFFDNEGIVTNPYDPVGDKNALYTLLAKEYALNSEQLSGIDLSKDMAKLPDLIEVDEIIKKVIEDANKNVAISDKMLAAIFENAIVSAAGLDGFNLKLGEVTITKDEISQDKYLTQIMMVLEIDLYSTFMKEAEKMPKIVQNLIKAFFDSGKKDGNGNFLPQKLYIQSGTILGGDELYKTVLRVNGLDDNETKEMLGTIINLAKSFMTNSQLESMLEIETLTTNVSDAVRNAIINVQGENGLNQALTYYDGGVYLPSIFQLVSGAAKGVVTALEVYDIIKGIHGGSAYEENISAIEFTNFIDEVNSDYFINEANKLTSSNLMTQISYVVENLGKSTLNLGKTSDSLYKTNKALNNGGVDDLQIILTEGALAQFLNQSKLSIIDKDGLLKSVSIAAAYIERGNNAIYETQQDGVMYLRLVIKVYMEKPEGNKYNNLLPETFYVVANINLDEVYPLGDANAGLNTYKTTVTLNQMTISATDNFFKLMKTFSAPSAITVAREEFEKEIQSSIAKTLGDITAKGKLEVEYISDVKGGRVLLPTIFDAIYNEIFGSNALTPSVVDFKNALQGMNNVSDFVLDSLEATSGGKLFNTDYEGATPIIDGMNSIVSDKLLSKLFNNRVGEADFVRNAGINGINVLQTMMVTSANQTAKMQEIIAKFDNLAISGKNVVLMNFEIPLTDFMPNTGLKDFLPQSVFGTVLIDKADGSIVSTINSLDDTMLLVVQKIINEISLKQIGGLTIDIISLLDLIEMEFTSFSLQEGDSNFALLELLKKPTTILEAVTNETNGIGQLKFPII